MNERKCFASWARMIDLTAGLWRWNVTMNGMWSVLSFCAISTAVAGYEPFGGFACAARLLSVFKMATVHRSQISCILYFSKSFNNYSHNHLLLFSAKREVIPRNAKIQYQPATSTLAVATSVSFCELLALQVYTPSSSCETFFSSKAAVLEPLTNTFPFRFQVTSAAGTPFDQQFSFTSAPIGTDCDSLINIILAGTGYFASVKEKKIYIHMYIV